MFKYNFWKQNYQLIIFSEKQEKNPLICCKMKPIEVFTGRLRRKPWP